MTIRRLGRVVARALVGPDGEVRLIGEPEVVADEQERVRGSEDPLEAFGRIARANPPGLAAAWGATYAEPD